MILNLESHGTLDSRERSDKLEQQFRDLHPAIQTDVIHFCQKLLMAAAAGLDQWLDPRNRSAVESARRMIQKIGK